jgi:RsiW-degrading membrane proteinase PrsW (M82 family)
MIAVVAGALNNTQATAYATVAALIPAFGFIFVLGARMQKGQETWIWLVRMAARGLFLLMVAGEVAAFISLLADRYSGVAHAFVIAGIAAATVGLLIEGLIHLRVLGEPGSSGATE